MDLFLDKQEYANYRVWLHSPSVHGSETETILAYKIGQEIHGIPSRVLRILRGVPGQDPELQKQVEEFVARDENLFFVGEGEGRTIDVRTPIAATTLRDDAPGDPRVRADDGSRWAFDSL